MRLDNVHVLCFEVAFCAVQLIYINPVGEGVTPEGLQIIPTVVCNPSPCH